MDRPRQELSDPGPGLLFVYGTLRRGGAAAALLQGAPSLGAARFQGRLYDLGSYPGAVASDDAGACVHGELYALAPGEADALLARLDRYEGPHFRRARARVTDAAGEARAVWIYLYVGDLDGLAPIVCGDYLAGSARA